MLARPDEGLRRSCSMSASAANCLDSSVIFRCRQAVNLGGGRDKRGQRRIVEGGQRVRTRHGRQVTPAARVGVVFACRDLGEPAGELGDGFADVIESARSQPVFR